MIISKTPFRISLFGGGTDLPAYLNRAKVGLTVGFAINKYCYIFFRHGNNLMNYNYRIAYSKIEFTKTINKIDIGLRGESSVQNCWFSETPYPLLVVGYINI